MFIDSAVLGPVEVSPENIFYMPEGLYGFDKEGEYALITKQEDDVTLRWLQAVDSHVPCFVVFNPFEIIDGYAPILEPADLRGLNCNSAADLRFFVIAVVPEDIRKITVNLKSPIAVNKQDRRARQGILSNPEYPIKFPIFPQEQGGPYAGD